MCAGEIDLLLATAKPVFGNDLPVAEVGVADGGLAAVVGGLDGDGLQAAGAEDVDALLAARVGGRDACPQDGVAAAQAGFYAIDFEAWHDCFGSISQQC